MGGLWRGGGGLWGGVRVGAGRMGRRKHLALLMVRQVLFDCGRRVGETGRRGCVSSRLHTTSTWRYQ